MPKNVLVIGGTYFAGRVFAMIAAREAGFHLTFINRGHYSMSQLPNVKEYACDRHNVDGLRALPADEYDAVVDFCAYSVDDVSILLTNLPGKCKKYIMLSTADVYDRSYLGSKDETTPLQEVQIPGPSGAYMFGKVKAELCAKDMCMEKGINLTILRPAFIYGPYNYAPRESYYVQKIVKKEQIPVPVDAKGEFQFVYVKDVANAIIACVNNETGSYRAYNLAAPEVMTYDSFMAELRKVSDLPFETCDVTVEQAIARQLPLPFPLMPEESELFDGSLICRELGVKYTPFRAGLQRAYEAFKYVYSEQ